MMFGIFIYFIDAAIASGNFRYLWRIATRSSANGPFSDVNYQWAMKKNNGN